MTPKQTAKLTVERRILNAIGKQKEQLNEIISINIPVKEQGVLLQDMIAATGKLPEPGLKLMTIFGVPVKKSKKLSITIEI